MSDKETAGNAPENSKSKLNEMLGAEKKLMFTSGICGDGAAILNNGTMMSIEEIVDQLNSSIELERQYSQQLGNLAQLCDQICPWILNNGKLVPIRVASAADEIMGYVDAVRP